jgi:hypothetical protein
LIPPYTCRPSETRPAAVPMMLSGSAIVRITKVGAQSFELITQLASKAPERAAAWV